MHRNAVWDSADQPSNKKFNEFSSKHGAQSFVCLFIVISIERRENDT
jgi:hypothetical protein